MSQTAEEITAAIASKGEEIRVLKQSKPATLKTDLEPLIASLLSLKLQYKEITGNEFGPPKPPAATPVAGATGTTIDAGQAARVKAKADRIAKAAEQNKQAAATAAAKLTATSSEEVDNTHLYGDVPMIQSRTQTEKSYKQLIELTDERINETIWLRGRISKNRSVGKGVFLMMRQNLSSVQCVMFQSASISKSMIKFTESIPLESIVDIRAIITKANTPIQSATLCNIELQMLEVHVISRAQELPFSPEDAGRNEQDAIDKDLPLVNSDTLLNYRWIDTRTPANQAIFRIQSGVCMLFREFFIAKGFVEIHTPKLIGMHIYT